MSTISVHHTQIFKLLHFITRDYKNSFITIFLRENVVLKWTISNWHTLMCLFLWFSCFKLISLMYMCLSRKVGLVRSFFLIVRPSSITCVKHQQPLHSFFTLSVSYYTEIWLLRRVYSERQAHTASDFIYGPCTISPRLIAYSTELAKQSSCSGSSLCFFFLLAKPLSCTEEAVLLLMWT